MGVDRCRRLAKRTTNRRQRFASLPTGGRPKLDALRGVPVSADSNPIRTFASLTRHRVREEVVAPIHKALQHIEPERLIISNDCGYGCEGMSRTHAYFKMLSIVRGTNIVRRELGLPKIYVAGEGSALRAARIAPVSDRSHPRVAAAAQVSGRINRGLLARSRESPFRSR